MRSIIDSLQYKIEKLDELHNGLQTLECYFWDAHKRTPKNVARFDALHAKRMSAQEMQRQLRRAMSILVDVSLASAKNSVANL